MKRNSNMLEMRAVLKKINSEENCYRYYEVVLRKEGIIYSKRDGADYEMDCNQKI